MDDAWTPADDDDDLSDGDCDYEVGYGRPPVHSRFPKGSSGNSAGRRRGSVNQATMVKKVAFQRTKVRRDGKIVTRTNIELVVEAVRIEAAKGNLTAIALIERLSGYGSELEVTAPKGIFITIPKLPIDKWMERYGHLADRP